MGEAVVVEDVHDAELSNRDHQSVGGPDPAKLVEVGVDGLAGAPQVDRLAQEQAWKLRVGRRLADLVGLPAGKTGNPERVAQSEALVDLSIGPRFGAHPGFEAHVQGHVGGLAPAHRRIEAVGPTKGRREGQVSLLYDGGLPVRGPGL
jgi:hypothetical protein